jgi:hypothetical protein
MYLSQRAKLFWSVLLTIFLTNIPYVASAEVVQQQMIPTAAVISEMNQRETHKKVLEFLGRADVQNELVKRGVSPEEAAQRLASLSEQELKQLSQQMDQARAGGDVFGILVVVLLVILIIYFAKRI